MKKKYYEVVFEGSFDVICGMLEGFMLGRGADWDWHHSRESGIDAETFTDVLKEWASLKTRLHHIIMEEEFHNAFQKVMEERSGLRFIKPKYVKSAKEIKSCSFDFSASAYAKKYADEIKKIITTPREGVTIENYSPEENIDTDAKGVELYSPAHDYEFSCEGKATGSFGDIVPFRKLLNDHPLVKVSSVKLNF